MLILFALTKGFLDTIPVSDILRFEKEIFEYVENNYPAIFDTIKTTKKLPNNEDIDKAINEFKGIFSSSQFSVADELKQS